MAIDPKSPLTLRALEDHLWAAADLFRNKVSNQKDYILALLFFKRASDRHREETALALAELDGVPSEEALAIIEANPRAYHSLRIPDKHFWEDVVDADRAGLGQALNDALTAIGRRTRSNSPASSSTPTSTTSRRCRPTTSPRSSTTSTRSAR